MDVVSGVTTFSHILSIKDKLFHQQKEAVSDTEGKSSPEKYCSLFLEHSYDPRELGSNDKEKIELVVAKKSEFTIPIRHLDWVFLECKLDPLKPINCNIPELLLVENGGYLLVLELKEVLSTQIKYLNLEGRQLKKSLESMVVQCTYADNYKQIVIVPLSLKESLYELHSSK